MTLDELLVNDWRCMHEDKYKKLPGKLAENPIRDQIIDYINLHSHGFAWINDSYGVFDPTRKRFRKGNNPRRIAGTSDIGFLWRGLPGWCETKKPKTREQAAGKLSTGQREFLHNINGYGGIGIAAWCLEDFKYWLPIIEPIAMAYRKRNFIG